MNLLKNFNLIWLSRGKYWRRKDLKSPFPLRVGSATIEIQGAGSGAAATYWEVYIDDFYGIRNMSMADSSTIVDIGANIGFFSCYARLKFPNSKIFAYEPSPSAFRFLEINTKQSDINIFQAAVARSDGVAGFDLGTDSTLGALSETGSFQVKTVSSSRLANGGPIDILKMDCEGGEWEILEDIDLLSRTTSVLMEYHLSANRTLTKLTELLIVGGHEIRYRRGYSDSYGFLESFNINKGVKS